MDKEKQLAKLLESQDILRRVWAEQKCGILKDYLREIDKQMSKSINMLGGTIEKYNKKN